jgi:transcription elongation factor GreA
MQVPKRKAGKYAKIPKDNNITQTKFDEIKQKIKKLKKSHPHAASEVVRLAKMGDFSENVAYSLAKGRLRWINQTILDLEKDLKNAKIIKTNKSKNIIKLGHTVVVKQNNIKTKYTILGSAETDPTKKIISHLSPIGSALLNHKVGDVVTIKIKNKNLEFEILEIL